MGKGDHGMTDAERITELERRVADLEQFVAKWVPALSGDITRSMAYVLSAYSKDLTPNREAMLDAIYENFYTLNPSYRPKVEDAVALKDGPHE